MSKIRWLKSVSEIKSNDHQFFEKASEFNM